MWILFAALSAVLLLILIRQRILYRKLQKEIEYISNRLTTLSASVSRVLGSKVCATNTQLYF